jgi:hypothetical protein
MLREFNGGCKDQHARLLLEESITLRLWLDHLGLELPPASTLSDNLNAISNRTRGLIEQVQWCNCVLFYNRVWMIFRSASSTAPRWKPTLSGPLTRPS